MINVMPCVFLFKQIDIFQNIHFLFLFVAI